ncbi:M10 family metallopeptidase [Microvirga vignae]|uniref:M10 family metallopeptidase n=1 Tax=Microvirga vignae TaxID=1225564 RepID=UPI00069AF751|nr:M10 family metallopeptidase [Microvirga vignae]
MSTVQLSGNQSIDGLLSTVKWDLTTLDFSFPQFASLYGADYGIGEPDNNFQPVNETQQSALRYALFYISSYTNLQFNEIEETADNHGSIRFSMTSASPTAHGYFPMGLPMDGDIWMNPNGGPNYTTPKIGNWGLATIMHELGHTLGLKHGHDPNGVNQTTPGALPTNEDTWSYSLMTYRSYVGASVDNGVQGPTDNGNPTTYMQNDIAALQYMYGANFNTNAGNTTYRWNPTSGEFTVDGVSWGIPESAKIFMTVWDGNGIDTYDLSAYSTNLIINLQPGAFSTFSLAQVTDLDAGPNVRLAPGNVANARLFLGDVRSLIENAVGGSGNDRIAGNTAANTLSGGSGNDTLNGSSGADRMTGGAGNDICYVDNTGDRVIETSSGGTADRVYTSISLTLAASVEQLYAYGSAAINLTGNTLANVIKGNAASNKIYGGAGNDVLYGGTGTGRDIFVFNTALNSSSNKDRIMDWSATYDTIQLENRYFTKLTKTGTLSSSFFKISSKALDANDYIGYDKATGNLWYDSNGNAAGGQVVFANVGANKAIAYNDFVVV